jgi:hypothetical protein
MIRKVVLVISLFVIVDRVMYHKLGQNLQQEKYAHTTISTSPLHEAALKKRKIRERIIAHARALYLYRVS